MASRRNLKKTIQFVSSELITDVYFRCLMSNKIEEDEVDKIVMEIAENSREYILRANRPTGKDNPQLVKAYFRKLYADWQKTMEKIVGEIEKL
jgi:hypothetical protein